MKKRKNTYREVDKLPGTAISVSEYANNRDIDPSYVYKMWRRHIDQGRDIDFEIVVFKNINFVLPKKQKASG